MFRFQEKFIINTAFSVNLELVSVITRHDENVYPV